MKTLWVAALVFLLGCGPDSQGLLNDGDLGDEEGLEFVASELNATKLLEFVNSAEATATLLRAEVGLDTRAATGIAARRDGADGQLGTADDRPFATVAELDAVPWVGTVALARLDTYAGRLGGAPAAVTVEGIDFSSTEAADALAVVNGPLLDQVTLTSTARNSLLARRPFTELVAVGAAPYIGPSALTALRSAVRANPITAPGGACIGTGGTYDGVAFTRDEECLAVDFMNRARFSEMGKLTSSARLAIYLAGPDGVWRWKRTSAWVSVAAFSRFTGMGSTAVSGLKVASTGWVQSGAMTDTVASTWAARATLVDGPVLLERAYVSKVSLEVLGEGGYTWQCAQIRDTPTSPNYLQACFPHFACEGGDCWGADQGTYRMFRGTLRRSALPGFGGYRLSLGGS